MNEIWSPHCPSSGGIIDNGKEGAKAIKEESNTSGRMDIFFSKKRISIWVPYSDSQLTNCIFYCGLLMVTKEFQYDSFGLETSP